MFVVCYDIILDIIINIFDNQRKFKIDFHNIFMEVQTLALNIIRVFLLSQMSIDPNNE